MLIHLHKQATTTPKVRAAIQASTETAPVLAERFGVTEQTVYKWRHRDSVEDRSHTPHRLQTTLTPAQEAVAVALRRTLLVSLDDLLAVVREFLNPNASRSGLDRCLRRHGVGNLRDLKDGAPRPKHSGFKAYEPGYIHIDVKYLPQTADESSRRYLFVGIDRATRWVFIRVFKTKTAANARRFLRDLERACPLRIRTVLTDNGKEFTDRLFGLRKRAATGQHEFDTLCAAFEIDHRLTPPKSPQTNGMVERFNGRIEEVLQSHHFRSGEELETTLHRYVWLYNQQLPQSALGSKTPLKAMKDWHKLKPELFKKQPYYLTGCDTYATPALYERLEEADYFYAIRLPANAVLREKIAHQLTRPVGRPSKTKVKRFYEDFQYQAQSWDKPRRVIAKIEWHPGELFPRVGFIVTNLPMEPDWVVRFYSQRGTAEQHIKEGKYAFNWTRLSCRRFRDNEVRLHLHALAYNLATFLRCIELPEEMADWSLTSLQLKLIKTGARVVRHARAITFQLSEAAVSGPMVRTILAAIHRLRAPPSCA